MSSREHSRDTKSKRPERSNATSRKQDGSRKRSRARSHEAGRHNAAALPDTKAKKGDENSQPLHSDAADKRNATGKSKSDSNRSKSDHGKSETSKHRSTHEKRKSSKKHDAGKNGVEKGRHRSSSGRRSHRHDHERKADSRLAATTGSHSSKSSRKVALESDKRGGSESHSSKLETVAPPAVATDADTTTQADVSGPSVDPNLIADASGSLDRKRHARRYLPPPSDAPVKFTLSMKARANIAAPERAFDEDLEGTDTRAPDTDVLREPDFHLELGFDSEDMAEDQLAESRKNFQIVFNSKTATRLVEHDDSLHTNASPLKRDVDQLETKQHAQNSEKRDESSRSGQTGQGQDEPRLSKSNAELRDTRSYSQLSRTSMYIANASGPEMSTEDTVRQLDATGSSQVETSRRDEVEDKEKRTQTETDASRSSRRRDEEKEKTKESGDAAKKVEHLRHKEAFPGSTRRRDDSFARRRHDESFSKSVQNNPDDPTRSKRDRERNNEQPQMGSNRYKNVLDDFVGGALRFGQRRRGRGMWRQRRQFGQLPRGRNREKARHAAVHNSRQRAPRRSRRSRSRRRSHSRKRTRRGHHHRRRSGSSSSSTSSSASSRSRSSRSSSYSSRSRSRSRSRSHRRATRRSRSRSRSAHNSRSRSTRKRSERRRPRTRSNSRAGTQHTTSQHHERTDSRLTRDDQPSNAGAHDDSNMDVSLLRRSSSPALERSLEPCQSAERLNLSVHVEDDQAAPLVRVAADGTTLISNEEYERRVEQFLMFTQRGSALLSDAVHRSAIDLLNLEHGAPATPTESTPASSNPPSAAPSSTMLALPTAVPKIDLQALVASLTSLQQPAAPPPPNGPPPAPQLPYDSAFPFIRTVVPPLMNAPFPNSFAYSLPPFAQPLDKLARPNGLAHSASDAYVYPPTNLLPNSTEANVDPFGGVQVQADDLNHSWQFNGTRSANFNQQSKSLQPPALDRSFSQSSTSVLDLTQPVKPKARWMNMLSESDSSSSPPPPATNAHPEVTERCDLRDDLRKSEDCAPRKLDSDNAHKNEQKRSESPERHGTMYTVYSRVTRRPLFDYITECQLTSGRRSRAARGRHQRAIRRMVCACSCDDQVPCGTGCLNRMLFIECGADCPCGSECTNRQFQQRSYAPIALTHAGAKGFGLVALASLEPDTFLMEYVGELLDTLQFTKRVREYDRSGKVQHHYFMQLNSELIIDATRKGNLSRFFNHSCEPNCETQKWTVNGQLRVGFFTQRRVERGEELTFDYQFQLYGDQQQKCYCSSAKCRGFLGTVRRAESALCTNGTSATDSRNAPEASAPSSKLIRVAKAALGTHSLEHFGASEIEEAIHKLVARARTGLRTAEQTLQLCRLLMRAERAEDRRALLDLLLLTAELNDPASDAAPNCSAAAAPATDGPSIPLPNGTPLSNAADEVLERTGNLFVNVGNSHPLRTFVNYHGLRILRMLLADVRTAGNDYEQPVNAEMRLAVLRVLRVLPIMYKKEVTESNVRSLLERWHTEIESKLLQAPKDGEEMQCEPEVKPTMEQPPCTSESPDTELDVKTQLPDAAPSAIAIALIDDASITPSATPTGEEQTNMDAEELAIVDPTEEQQPGNAVTPTDAKPVNNDAECKCIIEELFTKWLTLKDDPYKIPKLTPGDVRTQSTAPKPTPGPVPAARPTAANTQAQKRVKKKDSEMPLELKRQLFEASERARVMAEKLQAERNTLLSRFQAQLVRFLNESFSTGFVTLREDEPNSNFFIDSVTQRVGLLEDDGRMFTELVQLAKPLDTDTVSNQNMNMNIIQIEKPVTVGVTEQSRYSVMHFITAADLLNATLLNAAPLPSSSDPSLMNQLQTDSNLISAALNSLIGISSPGLKLNSTTQPNTAVLPSAGESTATNGPLPPSWACAETDDGRTYYYHTVTRKTQWTVPTAEEDAAENQKGAAAHGKTDHSASPTQSHADSSSSGLLNFASREADAADRKALKRIISETVVRQLSKMRNRHAESLEELSDATQFKELARRLSYSIYEKELKRMLASNKLSRIRLDADDEALPESHKGRKRSRKAASERENVRRKTKNFIVRYVHVKLAKVARRRKRAAKALNAETHENASPASGVESANQIESLNQDGSARSRSVSESNSTKRLKAALSQICDDSDDDGDGEGLFESAWKTACASQSEPDLDAELNRNDASASASPTASSSKRPKLASANE